MVLHVAHSILQARSPKRTYAVCNTAHQGDTRQRAQCGFTLVETLVALLIVVMVSAIIAMGAPSAIKAYQSTVAKSNAQTVLATMTTALRDELGSATKVKLNGSTVVSYECGEGYVATLVGKKSEIAPHRGPVKTAIDNRLGSGKNTSWALVPDMQVVSTQNDLYVTFDSITFDKTSRSFKVTNLGVYQDGNSSPIASIAAGYYSIRSPYCEEVTKWPWES